MKTGKKNINFLMLFVVIFFVALFMRFNQLAIKKYINNQDLVTYEEKRRETRSSEVQVRRGTIFDSQGIPIAIETTSYYLEALLKNPWGTPYVKDIDLTSTVLSQYVNMERDEILERLWTSSGMGMYQLEFSDLGGLSLETKKAIEIEKLPGIQFVNRPERRYLNDYYSSHLIGHTKNRDEQGEFLPYLVGQLGLEAAYDDVLNGQDIRSRETVVDSVGADMTLTLDSRLQNPLETLMDEYAMRYAPQTLQLYLVEVETGKLLAASQRPTFNLNGEKDGIQLWVNFLFGEAYEPGSTIKTLTTAVSHDRQLFTPYELFQSGSIQVYDQIVKDHNVVGWGAITFEEGFARSSNVAMVNLVQRMGDKYWADKLLEFGFGSSTDFGFGNSEVPGVVNFDSPVTRTMSGFGQGFSATPIQLLQAFSSIANDGEMVKVQVVDKIGSQQEFQRRALGRPISPEAANYVMKLMIDTVEKPYGTAQAFKNPTMTVAAKTGTAQIASPNGAGYLTGENDYYHSAVVFFPAEAPKYMIYLSMKQPATTYGQLGSQILGELFNRFATIVMSYD